MPQFDRLLLTYLYLAHASQVRRQLLVRDKILVLAGITALELGWNDISGSCRQRILLHNPRHLIRRWPDLAAAARSERFRLHLKQLRRKYSPERAEHMLHALGISPDDSPGADRSFRDRALMLIESLAQEPDDYQAAPRSGQPNLPRPVRSRPTGSPDALRRETTCWWPFWLGVGVWIALALVEVFRQARSG